MEVIRNLLSSPTGRRSLRNASFNSLNAVLRPLLFVLATPLLVRQLGADHYGLWILALTISGFSGVMAFGLGDATVKFVSKYRAHDDLESVVRVIRSTLGLYLGLGLVTWALLYVSAPLLVSEVFKIPSDQQVIAGAAIRVAAVGIAVRFVNSVFDSALFGFERYDIAGIVSTVSSSATIGLSVILVLLDYGVVALIISGILIAAADAVAKGLLLKAWLLPQLVVLPRIDRAAVSEVLSYGVFSWLQGVGAVLFSQVDRVIIVSFLGPAALGYYSVCVQAASFIHGLGARAISFLFPMSSAMFERGDVARLRRVYFHGQSAAAAIAAGLSLPLYVFAPQILTAWMGNEFAVMAGDTLRVLIVAFALMATSTVPFYFMNGTNFVRLNTIFALASGLTVALAAVWLVPMLGMIGAALARLANVPSTLIARVILHKRVLSDPRWFAGPATLLPVLAGFAPLLLLHFVRVDPGVTARWWPLLAVPVTLVGAGVAWSVGHAFSQLAAMANIDGPARCGSDSHLQVRHERVR